VVQRVCEGAAGIGEASTDVACSDVAGVTVDAVGIATTAGRWTAAAARR
jgi:hypothetical protein